MIMCMTIAGHALGQVQLYVEALSDDLAPTAGGAEFESFESVFLNDHGDFAVLAKLKEGVAGTDATTNSGIWRKFRLGDWSMVARKGDRTTPYFQNSLRLMANHSEIYRPVMDEDGRVAFRAKIDNAGIIRDGVWIAGEGSPHWLGAKGEAPANAYLNGAEQTAIDPEGNISQLDVMRDPDISPLGLVVMAATLRDGQLAGESGYWEFTPPLDVWKAPKANTLPDFIYSTATNYGSTALPDFFDLAITAISASGAVLVGQSADADDSIWYHAFQGGPSPTTNLSLVAKGATAAAGISGSLYGTFGVPDVNDIGDVVFWGSLSDAVSGAASGEGLWLAAGGSSPELIIRDGNAAPGFVVGNMISSLLDAKIDAGGKIVFTGYVGAEATDQGLWVHRASGTALIAKTGDTAPGSMVDVEYVSFGEPSMNDAGQIGFTALVENGGATGDRARRYGYWIGDAAGQLHRVIEEGMPVSLGAEDIRIVESFDVSALGLGGHLAVIAQFDDNTSAILRGILEDNTVPTVPNSISAQWLTSSSIRLNWTSSQDNYGGLDYVVRRDGVIFATVRKTEWVDQSVDPGTSYSYTIEAIDFQGNRSAESAPVVEAPPALGPEYVVDNSDIGFRAIPSHSGTTGHTDVYGSNSFRLSIGQKATWEPDLPVAGYYDVYTWVSADGVGMLETVEDDARYTIATISGEQELIVDQNTAPGQWLYLGMHAMGAGGEGSVSLERTTATRSAIADAVKWVLVLEGDKSLPSAPPNVTVNWLASTRTLIDWASSNDDLGVAWYRLYRNGVLLAELPFTQTEYTDNDSLVPGVTYGYSVEAIDYSGQSSGQTGVMNVTMPLTSVSVVVDNRDSGWSGSHSGLSGHTDAYNVDSFLLTVGQVATYTPSLPTPGIYEVQVWVSGGGSSLDPEARYTIHETGGTTIESFDQNTEPGEWYTLGSYEFAAGGSGSVSVERTTLDQTAVADAIRWVLVVDGDEGVPTVPSNLTVDWLTSTRGHISWGASSDDLGVASYRLYRDGVLLAELPFTQTEYTDNDSLVAGVTFGYSIEAIDYSGQSSDQSELVNMTMPLTGGNVTVDNRDSGWSGSHSGISGHADGYGVDSFKLSVGQVGIYTPNLPAEGIYELQVWVSGGGSALDPAARYTISGTGGTTMVSFDQNTAPGTWYTLGSYEFAAGESGSVSVERTTSDRTAIADAIRWVYLIPQIASFSVREMDKGQTVVLSVIGSGLYLDANGVQSARLFRNGVSISAASLQIVSPDELSLAFSIPDDAELGLWSFEYVRPDGIVVQDPYSIGIGDLSSDADGDRRSLLMEWALGGDPDNGNDCEELTPERVMIEDGGEQYLGIRYRQLLALPGEKGGNLGINYMAQGFTYIVETNDGLVGSAWSQSTGTMELYGAPVNNGDGTETVVVRLVQSVESVSERKFLRLRVEALGGDL